MCGRNDLFAQTFNNISFDLIVNSVRNCTQEVLFDTLRKKGFDIDMYKSEYLGFKVTSSDTSKPDMSIKKLLSKEPPYLLYFNCNPTEKEKIYQAALFYVFSIKDLPHYLLEANKSAVIFEGDSSNNIWAYNFIKDLNKEASIFHFYPLRKKGKITFHTEIILYDKKALLMISEIPAQ
ncbi:hypothetical protein [Sporocytophaga myxococcoides]|uniref:hypothetical protein n=1 Tax=Sporocytophaga myxococcoides TaxID=153721 RepID=UPI0018CF8F29|nr:hypothetical protein [Sporocytophaga myxococcoides]